MEEFMNAIAQRAWEHLRHLAVEIGPRPSTREGELRAAHYARDVLKAAGVKEVREELFLSGRETYWPYAISLGVGLLGNVLFLTKPNRKRGIIAALLNALGAWGFYAEANFDDHWVRRMLPKGVSQNVIGVIPAAEEPKRRIVLMGHLDTHRTPFFYNSPGLLRMFSTLVGAAFVSLPLSALITLMRALGHIPGLGGLLGLAAAFQAFAMGMSIQAETTPHTPGANDNASGAAVVLALAEYLVQHPLPHTEVWVVLTGCEEVGAYGADALLKSHGEALRDAYFVNVDMVGVGVPAILEREGLLKSYRPDPLLLRVAMEVAAEHPEWNTGPHPAGAYTDIGVIIKHGYRGITIDSVLPPTHPARQYMGYWHQMRDRFENVEQACVEKAAAYVLALLRRLDNL